MVVDEARWVTHTQIRRLTDLLEKQGVLLDKLESRQNKLGTLETKFNTVDRYRADMIAQLRIRVATLERRQADAGEQKTNPTLPPTCAGTENGDWPTKEMISAGEYELISYDIEHDPLSDGARQIFLAMWIARDK